MTIHRMMKVKEVAIELGYEPRQIRRMIKLGAIPAIRIHQRAIRIPRKWLENQLKDYPTVNEFKEAKEDQRLEPDYVAPTKLINKPVKPVEEAPKIEGKEVETEDMKKKAQNTDIVVNKPKAQKAPKFIANPKKRKTVIKEPVEDETENNPDNDPDYDMDEPNTDSSNNDEKIGLPSLF